MTRRVVLAALAALLAATLAVRTTGATFTAASTNKASTFSTAADWVPPAVTVVAPADGSYTNDKTPLLAGAAGTATGDSATVAVKIFRGASPAGTPVQAPTVIRYGSGWYAFATALADGTYTAQAAQSDNASNTGSATSTFTVDTVAPAPTAVSAANGGATPGRLEAGDSVTFAYSEPIAPGSVLSTFTGTSVAVRVRFFDNGAQDGFTVLDGSGAASVGLDDGTSATAGVNLRADVVRRPTTVAGTLTASDDGASFTVVLGAVPASSLPVSAAGAANMSWHPGAAPKDRAGNSVTVPGTAVSETDSDVDF